MSQLANWQKRFIDAIQQPGDAAIDLGQRSGLDVYRNNIRTSLIEALAEAYPHTRQLLGERFFSGLANAYVQQTPPTDPRLNRYGANLAEQLDSLPSLNRYRFVADICRLERARLEASHADEASALTVEQLATIDIESRHVAPLPASRCIHCRYDVEALWQSLEQGAPAAGLGDSGASYWLAVRHHDRVRLTRLDGTAARLYRALDPESAFGDIFENLLTELDSTQVLGMALGNLIALGALRDATALSNDH